MYNSLIFAFMHFEPLNSICAHQRISEIKSISGRGIKKQKLKSRTFVRCW